MAAQRNGRIRRHGLEAAHDHRPTTAVAQLGSETLEAGFGGEGAGDLPDAPVGCRRATEGPQAGALRGEAVATSPLALAVEKDQLGQEGPDRAARYGASSCRGRGSRPRWS